MSIVRDPVWRVVLLLTVMALVFPGSASAAPSVEETVQELNERGQALKGADCIRHADRYLKIVNDKAIISADKAYALQECMRYLVRVWWRQYADEVLSKSHEVFALFREDMVDANPDAAREVVISYVSVFLGTEVVRDRARLPEYMAVVGAHEKLLNANAQDPRADFFRGALCRAAEDWDQAARYMERYVSNAVDPDSYAYSVIALAYEQLKDFDRLLAAVRANVERFGSIPGVAVERAKLLARLVDTGKVDEARLLEMLPIFAHDGGGTAVLVAAIADQKLQAGDTDPAIAYGRLCYSVAPFEDVTPIIEATARYVAMTDPMKEARFLDYQMYGTAGPDGKTGTEDDCEDPLAGIASPLSGEVAGAIEARLKQVMPRKDCVYTPLGDPRPRADSIYGVLRDRGGLYLALDRPRDALRAFRSAWAAAPVQWIQESNGLVPRALKALDGTTVRANSYSTWQEFGSAGPDGQPGTDDDLVDPLAGEDLPPLPPEVRKALKEIAGNNKRSVDAYQLGGFACLALGEYEKGFDKLRAAYVMVEPGPDQATIVEGIAAAIKAFDGNALRANQYLLFQKYGQAGPDAQLGTEDDVDNILPAILRDIKKR